MILDPDTRTLTRCGRTVRLRGSGAKLLAALAHAYPRHATHDVLISTLYPDDEPEWPENVLKVQISLLRAVVHELDLQVINVWGKGYVLNEPVEIAGEPLVVLPPGSLKEFMRLMGSHPDRAAADAIMARMHV